MFETKKKNANLREKFSKISNIKWIFTASNAKSLHTTRRLK